MTKEELTYNIMSSNSFKYIKRELDKFFEANVVIPKGENRHKYADVLHKWIEGSTIVADSHICGVYKGRILEEASLILNEREYHIKPSVPVYEWQWLVKDITSSEVFVPQDHHTFDELLQEKSLRIIEAIKETKRIRK